MISRRALLAAPLSLTAGAAPVPLAATPISRLSTPWWKARHEAKLRELHGANPKLIWLGDSITENFERDGPEPYYRYRSVWERHYASLNALNLGFKGDATCHLLWRLRNGEVAGIAPKAAVILIGANNLGRLRWSADDSVAGIEAVVSETTRLLPRTRILLLGVLPCDRGPWVDETTLGINASLAARNWGPKVRYRDLGGLFQHGGQLDRSMFYDPLLHPPEPALHPTPQGMELIAKAIAPDLSAMIFD
jgi:lysophospholipase L1-like esterase